MKITQSLILAGRSGPGGWNAKQLEILGVSWPPQSGWQKRIEGNFIDSRDAERFLDLTGKTVRAEKPKKKTGVKTAVRSDLPFPPHIDPGKALPLHSAWQWLQRQSVEDRKMLQDALVYMVRKNASVTSEAPTPPPSVRVLPTPYPKNALNDVSGSFNSVSDLLKSMNNENESPPW